MTGYDLHTHTEASFDCRTTLDEYVDRVRRRGLAGVAVTDHNTIEGALRLRDSHPPFAVIVGSEITLDTGAHLIGLFLRQPVTGGALDETAAAIHNQGGIVVMPHPFRRTTGVLAVDAVEDRWPLILSQVDMIEVFNARSKWDENQRAMALAAHFGVAATAGSDAHRPTEIGGGQTSCDDAGGVLTPDALRLGDTRVLGVDQEAAEVRDAYHRREQFRLAALSLKGALPPVLWRWGKHRWEDWCNRRDKRRPFPMRDYGRFGSSRRSGAMRA